MKLGIGQKVSVKKMFLQEEVTFYAHSSLDSNPVHFDAEYAKKTFFKKPIVHGMLVASLFGGLLGSKLPGPGTILLGQTLQFLEPVYVDETIEIINKVISIREDKPIIVFENLCIKENGKIAIKGQSVVIYRGPFFDKTN